MCKLRKLSRKFQHTHVCNSDCLSPPYYCLQQYQRRSRCRWHVCFFLDRYWAIWPLQTLIFATQGGVSRNNFSHLPGSTTGAEIQEYFFMDKSDDRTSAKKFFTIYPVGLLNWIDATLVTIYSQVRNPAGRNCFFVMDCLQYFFLLLDLTL